MIKRNYQNLTMSEIRRIYGRILFKVTKNKDYRYHHPPLKKTHRQEVICLLMEKLQLTNEQATYLYEHKKQDDKTLKQALIQRDISENRLLYFKEKEYINRITSRIVFVRYHIQMITLISLSFLIVFLLTLASQSYVFGLMIGLSLFLFVVLLLIGSYLYYQRLFIFQNEIRKADEQGIQKDTVKVSRYRFVEYLDTNRRPPRLYDVFGVLIKGEIKHKKVRLFYPLYQEDLHIRDRKENKAYQEKRRLMNRLNQHKTLEVSYFRKSKVILRSSVDLEKALR